MATIRPNPRSPHLLEVRFSCPVTKKRKSIAVGSGDMQRAERLKRRIDDKIDGLKNGDQEKPSQRLIDAGLLTEWYRQKGIIPLPREDKRAEWLEENNGSWSLTTAETYSKHIFEFDLNDAKRSLQQIQNRTSVSTAKKYRTSFGTYWKWMVTEGFTTDRNPLAGFKFKKSAEKEERWTFRELSEHLKRNEELTPKDHRWSDVMRERVFLSDEELSEAKQWVRNFLSGTYYDRKFAIACLLSTEAGMRRGEIVRLRKQDLKDQIVTIRRTKGSASNHYRTTRSAVTVETAEELQRFSEDTEREYLFSRTAMPVDGTADFQAAVRKEATHLGNLLKTRASKFPFPGALFGYHLFRHSISARAKERGQLPVDTMALLGHQSKVMYHHYGGASEEKLIAAVNALS